MSQSKLGATVRGNRSRNWQFVKADMKSFMHNRFDCARKVSYTRKFIWFFAIGKSTAISSSLETMGTEILIPLVNVRKVRK